MTQMKLFIYILISCLYISSSGWLLYGWNNQYWIGNSERVALWNGVNPADYLRLGVLKDGVYRLSAADIAMATGGSTNNAISSLNNGAYSLSCGTNSVAWKSDGEYLYFVGQKSEDFYAPENVYFLRAGSGVIMQSRQALPDSGGGTNLWFMQSGSHRAEFLDVDYYYDRRSSNASITNAPVFGEWLEADTSEATRSRSFSPVLPGFAESAETNINFRVDAISYGDYAVADDNHAFEIMANGISYGSFSWGGEQLVASQCAVPGSAFTNNQALVSIRNLNSSGGQKDILLLDVEINYPRLYQVGDQPLLCSGGSNRNIAVSGLGNDSSVMILDSSDPLRPVVLDVIKTTLSNHWSSVFSCGGVTNNYAVFKVDDCYQPSVTGFADIDWLAAGQISELVIVTPPRRWVSGFEEALAPLVELRRRQNLSVRIVDAEDIYNAFSYGLVNPHAFQRFAAAGLNSGSSKPLRYMLFAGYASTDYKLETFIPDTEFKNGKKGFPALFPLLQVFQLEVSSDAMLLLPNDMMLGDTNDSGVPDVVVGRFLATDATELSDMVAKTVKHDAPHLWNRAIVVSDWDDPVGTSYDFSAFCDGLAADYADAGWDISRYSYPSAEGSVAIYKNIYYEETIWNNLHEGRDLFYYLGHSNDAGMGAGSYYTRHILNNVSKYVDPDYKQQQMEWRSLKLADWEYAPFGLCMGCRMGRYTSLDVVGLSACLMETAARNSDSGFSTTISAAGYLSNGDAKQISTIFSEELNLYGALRVGDAYIAALDQFGAAGLAHLQHLVLLGDPSMPLRKIKYGTVILFY